MNTLRRNIPLLAATVLLLWLFAAGTAFAQACASAVHPCCEECCTELSAAPTSHELRQDTPPSSAASWVLPAAAVRVRNHIAMAQPSEWHRTSDPTPPERIPILFLRLAL